MKVGLLGYGVVGKGVKILCDQQKGISINKVLVKQDRVATDFMTADFQEVLSASDVIVECIGGINDAYYYIKQALTAKKHVVTSNKKVMAVFYEELINLAKDNNVTLNFDAAVGGAIAIMPNIRHIKTVDEIESFTGILNGTTNFILDQMYSDGCEFNEALIKAQSLGFAEKDPKDDIKGLDVKYKACLLANYIWDTSVKLDNIISLGIDKLNKADLEFAKKVNKTIKLLAMGKISDKGINIVVLPKMFNNDYLCNIGSNLNGIKLSAKKSKECAFIAQGAGSIPTAYAVVQDILSLNKLPQINKREFVHNHIANFYVRSNNLKKFKTFILKETAENSFISIKMNLIDLKKIVHEDDFVAEIEI